MPGISNLIERFSRLQEIRADYLLWIGGSRKVFRSDMENIRGKIAVEQVMSWVVKQL